MNVVESGGHHQLPMLHSLPMAGAEPRDLISIAGLLNMLIVTDTIEPRDLGHRFRPNKCVKLSN